MEREEEGSQEQRRDKRRRRKKRKKEPILKHQRNDMLDRRALSLLHLFTAADAEEKGREEKTGHELWMREGGGGRGGGRKIDSRRNFRSEENDRIENGGKKHSGRSMKKRKRKEKREAERRKRREKERGVTTRDRDMICAN